MRKLLMLLAVVGLVSGASAEYIYENGPLGTGSVMSSTGTASPAGSWWSEVQVPGTIAGYGNQVSANNRVADDFTVPAGGSWQIDSIGFFGYQTNSGTTSTLTSYDVKIWSGAAPGVTLVWSGVMPVTAGPAWPTWAATAGTPPPWPTQPPWTAAQIGATPVGRSSFTNLYRIFAPPTAPGTTRPVMFTKVPTAGLPALGPGQYWVDWMTNGTGASGPWAPQVTIGGLAGKPGANGMQSVAGGAWAFVADPAGGTRQDFPFVLIPEPTSLLLLGLGLLLRRR